MTTCLPPGPGNIDPHRSNVCPTGAAAVSYFSLSSHRVTGLQLPSCHIINILTKTAGYHKMIVLTHLYGDIALHCTCHVFRDNNYITKQQFSIIFSQPPFKICALHGFVSPVALSALHIFCMIVCFCQHVYIIQFIMTNHSLLRKSSIRILDKKIRLEIRNWSRAC